MFTDGSQESLSSRSKPQCEEIFRPNKGRTLWWQGCRNSWRARRGEKLEGNGNDYKQKSPYQLCLLLFRHNVDLKNITEINRKTSFLGARIVATNLFQIVFDKQWNYLWQCYEKAFRPSLPPFWKVRGTIPLSCPALRRHWFWLFVTLMQTTLGNILWICMVMLGDTGIAVLR